MEGKKQDESDIILLYSSYIILLEKNVNWVRYVHFQKRGKNAKDFVGY
jgi:hypothetical protein